MISKRPNPTFASFRTLVRIHKKIKKFGIRKVKQLVRIHKKIKKFGIHEYQKIWYSKS